MFEVKSDFPMNFLFDDLHEDEAEGGKSWRKNGVIKTGFKLQAYYVLYYYIET